MSVGPPGHARLRSRLGARTLTMADESTGKAGEDRQASQTRVRLVALGVLLALAVPLVVVAVISGGSGGGDGG